MRFHQIFASRTLNNISLQSFDLSWNDFLLPEIQDIPRRQKGYSWNTVLEMISSEAFQLK